MAFDEEEGRDVAWNQVKVSGYRARRSSGYDRG